MRLPRASASRAADAPTLRIPSPKATAMSELAEAPGAKKAQVKKYLVRLRGTEIPLVLVKAAALFALCWLFV